MNTLNTNNKEKVYVTNISKLKAAYYAKRALYVKLTPVVLIPFATYVHESNFILLKMLNTTNLVITRISDIYYWDDKTPLQVDNNIVSPLCAI